MLELCPPVLCRITNVRPRQFGMTGEMVVISCDKLFQCLLGTGAQGQHVRPAVPFNTIAARDRRFFQYDVSVRAAKTERADPGDTTLVLRGPPAQFGYDPDREFIPCDVRVRILEMQMRRNRPWSSAAPS